MKKFLVAAALVAATIAPAAASAFWHGTVVGVANWDVLNVRKWPSSQSQIIDVYDNGDDVSMSGRCKDIVTNWSFRVDGGQSATWKYNRMKRANVWCQVSAPNGQIGWVRGSFVMPD
jgi:opacity protein-like surface antigen